MASHLVLIPLPAHGHVVPFLYLARKLALHGITSTIINIDSIHETLLETWQDDPSICLQSIPMDLKLSTGFDEKNFDAQMAFVNALLALEDSLVELLSEINRRGDTKVSCVVSDLFHLCAPHAARKAGLRSACFWCGSAAWGAIEFHLPRMIQNGDCPVREGDDKLVSYIPGMELRSQDLPRLLHKEEFDKVGEEISLFRSKRFALDSWILVNSVRELEPMVFEAMDDAFHGKFVPVGPLFPLERADDVSTSIQEVNLRTPDESCLPWLSERSRGSVLYVAFGSISFMSSRQFEELALGLEATKVPFLWVIRSNTIVSMNEEFFAAFQSRTRGRGLVVSWAPQLTVLRHESIGAFLTHCGWNSVLESLSCGVPMLGWPCMFDQNTNAKLVLEREGVGLRLIPRAGMEDGIEVDREEIGRKVRMVMDEEAARLRGRAMELRGFVADAAAPGGSSHSNLEAFIRSIGNCKHNRITKGFNYGHDQT